METLSIANVREYPKIETLYDRDEKTFKVIDGRVRCPEFSAINRWHVTEKIDGTNIRVAWIPPATSESAPSVFIGGRTNDAQLPPHLRQMLTDTVTLDRLAKWVRPDTTEPVVFYGEGYGAKIQKGGGNYRATPGFRLFDVRVGETWIEQLDVSEIALAMGIDRAPVLHTSMSTADAIQCVRAASVTACEDGGPGCQHEGIVCRSAPTMLDRLGHRIVWKLKAKDFASL